MSFDGQMSRFFLLPLQLFSIPLALLCFLLLLVGLLSLSPGLLLQLFLLGNGSILILGPRLQLPTVDFRFALLQLGLPPFELLFLLQDHFFPLFRLLFLVLCLLFLLTR